MIYDRLGRHDFPHLQFRMLSNLGVLDLVDHVQTFDYLTENTICRPAARLIQTTVVYDVDEKLRCG